MNKKHFPNAKLKLVQEIYHQRAENIKTKSSEAIGKCVLYIGQL
jgi:hypothetical protein